MRTQKKISTALAVLLGLQAITPTALAGETSGGVKGSDGPEAITKDGVERWIQSEDIRAAMRHYLDSVQRNQISNSPEYAHAKIMLGPGTKWQELRNAVNSYTVNLGGRDCSESKPGKDSKVDGKGKGGPRAWTLCGQSGGTVCFNSEGLMEDFKAQSGLSVESMKMHVAAVYFHEFDHQLTSKERCEAYSDAAEKDANSLASYVLFSAKSGQAWTMVWSEKPLTPLDEVDPYLGDKALGDFFDLAITGVISGVSANQAKKIWDKYKAARDAHRAAQENLIDLKEKLKDLREDTSRASRADIEKRISQLEGQLPGLERSKESAAREALSFEELAKQARTGIEHKLNTQLEEVRQRSATNAASKAKVTVSSQAVEVTELGAGAADLSAAATLEVKTGPGKRSASSVRRAGKESSLNEQDFANARNLSDKAATAAGSAKEAEAKIRNTTAEVTRLRNQLAEGPYLEVKIKEGERTVARGGKGVKAQGATAGLVGAAALVGAVKAYRDAQTFISDVRKGALDGGDQNQLRRDLRQQRGKQQMEREAKVSQ